MKLNLTDKEFVTEIKGNLTVVDHIEGNLYCYYDGSKQIRVVRVPSEVFKTIEDAKKYFK